MAELIEVAQAREAVLSRVAPLPAEEVSLAEALGRVLAADALASEPVPGYDGSAMDGYALRAADIADATGDSPARLEIVGESRAGHPSDRELAAGEAIAISTGAVVPTGADAVLRVEDTSREGDTVSIRRTVEPGNDIRRAGEDIEPGRLVLPAGATLGAVEVGVLASLDRPAVLCAARPRIGLITTGDELLEPGEPSRPGGVRSSNGYVLPALAALAGAEAGAAVRAGDDADATREALAVELERSDVLVISGGVSVGEHDHVRGSLQALGVEQVFWGVSLRPGKPTYFGLAAEREGRRTMVFGLPGNPVSACVTFLLFARPALRAMQGADPARTRVQARLANAQPRMSQRTQAVRCSLELTGGGWLATPTGAQGSHVLTSLIGADGLAVIGPGNSPAEAGEPVEVELLSGLGA
jgi:molybdopterin molybdotransferase